MRCPDEVDATASAAARDPVGHGAMDRRYAAIIAAAAMLVGGSGRRPILAEVQVVVGSPGGKTPGGPDATRVNEPFAVAFDAEGGMYGVEHQRGNRLFRVHAGDVEFVAGRFHVSQSTDVLPRETATAAAEVRFHGPHDVAVGRDGRVFVADTLRHQIRAFDPKSRTVRVVAGTGEAGFSGDGGPAAMATFKQAYCSGLAPDGTALLVADIGNSRLRRIDLVQATVATIAGNGIRGRPVDGAAAVASPLAGPRAACMTADGTIYLALREGNALVEIVEGQVRTVVNASGKSGYGGDDGPGREALLAGPKYVSLDRAGRVLIADTENHCIRRYDPRSGRIRLIAGIPGRMGAGVGSDLASTHLARPHGCCIGPDGRLVIADSDNDRILAGDVAE